MASSIGIMELESFCLTMSYCPVAYFGKLRLRDLATGSESESSSKAAPRTKFSCIR